MEGNRAIEIDWETATVISYHNCRVRSIETSYTTQKAARYVVQIGGTDGGINIVKKI